MPCVAVLASLGDRGRGARSGRGVARRAAPRERPSSARARRRRRGPGHRRPSSHVTVSAGPSPLDCVLDYEDDGRPRGARQRRQLAPSRPATTASPDEGRGPAIPCSIPAGYHLAHPRARRRRASGRDDALVAPTETARGAASASSGGHSASPPHSSPCTRTRSWGCGDLGGPRCRWRRCPQHRSSASVVSTLPLLSPASARPPSRRAPTCPSAAASGTSAGSTSTPSLDARSPRRTWTSRSRRSTRSAAAAAGHPYVDGARGAAGQARRAPRARGRPRRRPATRERAAFDVIPRPNGPKPWSTAQLPRRRRQPRLDWRRWPRRDAAGRIAADDVDASAGALPRFAQWLPTSRCTRRRAAASGVARSSRSTSRSGCIPSASTSGATATSSSRAVSVGAPPDRFFPRGQGWGFPPPHPDAARRDGHRPFRAALVHHLTVAGMLRIDHVLGLQRLFWCPTG